MTDGRDIDNMTTRKKLIEVALPLDAINEASVRESYIYKGNPSSLHKWWAQRPLAAARAVIFASLIDDPGDPDFLEGTLPASEEYVAACQALPKCRNASVRDTPRQRLFDFIEVLIQWESNSRRDILDTANHLIRLSTNNNPPSLLDPFAGGGTIPVEAQRLGLEAYATDLNPVAVMLNKALIEIPPEFHNAHPVNPVDRSSIAGTTSWSGASGLAADIRYYGQWLRDRAFERIGQYYPDYNGNLVISWLWARTVPSPSPAVNAHVPLVRSFWLSSKAGRKIWAEPVVDHSTQSIEFRINRGKSGKAPKGTMSRQGGTCIISGAPIPFEYIRDVGRSGHIGTQLMAIAVEGNSGRDFYAPVQEHVEAAQVDAPNNIPKTYLPDKALGFRVQGYGILQHYQLFTSRQLLALTTFHDLLSDVVTQIKSDADSLANVDDIEKYARAVVVYLAFAINKYAMYGNAFVPWYAKESRPSMLFTRQTISMNWDFVEVNPFSTIGGSLIRSVEIVADVLDSLMTNKAGYSYQADAASHPYNGEPIAISTDPPYYDNIGYADLSDFFYIWLRRSIGHTYPNIFGTILTPKEREIIANPFIHDNDREAAEKHFENGLYEAFKQMYRIIHRDYPLTVYYAFRQAEITADEDTSVASTGWETMLEGLIQAGFNVVGTWPMRTERSGRMRDYESNALASSIVLVCRPRPENSSITSRREFVNTLRHELPTALWEMQSGNIAPVDLAQASIGPGMAVYSRYSQVLEPNGGRLTVRTALQIINQVLDEYLAEQEGDLDADSRFAVAWFEQYGFNTGEFGVADVLARAKNTAVDGLANAGILESGAGKVRLYHWSELDPGWDPASDKRLTVWEATHHLIERLNTRGEGGAAMLLASMPPKLADDARQLAYRLYAICDRKGWAEQARDYNALVISWSASQEQAGEYREQYQQGRLF